MSPVVTQSDDPAATAGARLAERLRAVLEERPHVRLAVAGGSALSALYPAMSALGDGRSRVRMTWVDERCVTLADPDSNRGATHAALGDLCPRLELPLWLDDEDVDGALRRVRSALSEEFDDGLDVTLLGMGGDGHIASLFAGRTLDADRVAHIPDSPKPPPRRMTLTRPLLASAKAHVLLATGEKKRVALTRLIAGDTSLPAVGLSGLDLVTDLDLDLEKTT